MQLPRNVTDSATMARMGFRPTVHDVMQDVIMRYHGDDARTLSWLSDIAAATALLVILDRGLKNGRLNAEQRIHHAALQRDLAALRPALTECLGDVSDCVFGAVVDTAGASWGRVFENAARAGMLGHA